MGLDQDSDSFLSLNGEVVFLGGSRHFRVSKKRQDFIVRKFFVCHVLPAERGGWTRLDKRRSA